MYGRIEVHTKINHSLPYCDLSPSVCALLIPIHIYALMVTLYYLFSMSPLSLSLVILSISPPMPSYPTGS